MGLFVARVQFDGEPPSDDEILSELGRRIGSIRAVEPIERHDNELNVAAMLDPVAYPYLMKILSERGGRLLHYGTGEPRKFDFPEYVETPWVDLGIGMRVAIRVRFFLGLLATVRRKE
ncbi:MAG: hypothetical protein ACHREM_19905 [Polyangiales bacterium]